MSRFSFKIYAVLLVMGAVPLLASAVLISEVLTFNKDVQDEAVETLDDVALFHRAWARSEAEHIALIGESLASSDDVASADLQRATASLQQASNRYEVLRRAELLEAATTIVDVAAKAPKDAEDLKLRSRSWELPEQPGRLPRTLRLTFGVDQRLAERYEALGQRRRLHRGLSALEGEQEGSLTEVSQKFYYLMLALVIVLTIGLALLVTTPVSRRVGRLAQATRQVAKGDLTVQLPVKGRDELAQLTEHFNQMVSELRDARRNLAYLERMAAWQEVARRLAHEIKNPLTPLLLAIQQLDRTFDKYRDDPERYRRLVTDVVEIVTEEVETLRKLVKEFSEFARLPSAEPKPLDYWDFVHQTLRSNPQFYEAADIVELGGPPIFVRLDPTLMRRVIVNVVQNAIEAAHEAGNAHPSVTLAVALDDDTQFATLTVRDDGPGFTEQQLERAFEPYFTTKETGTGLGLAIVRKIILDHGGDIRLANRPDREGGAQVTITLATLTQAQLASLHARVDAETQGHDSTTQGAAGDEASANDEASEPEPGLGAS